MSYLLHEKIVIPSFLYFLSRFIRLFLFFILLTSFSHLTVHLQLPLFLFTLPTPSSPPPHFLPTLLFFPFPYLYLLSLTFLFLLSSFAPSPVLYPSFSFLPSFLRNSPHPFSFLTFFFLSFPSSCLPISIILPFPLFPSFLHTSPLSSFSFLHRYSFLNNSSTLFAFLPSFLYRVFLPR